MLHLPSPAESSLCCGLELSITLLSVSSTIPRDDLVRHHLAPTDGLNQSHRPLHRICLVLPACAVPEILIPTGQREEATRVQTAARTATVSPEREADYHRWV